MTIQYVTDQNFDDVVMKSGKLVLVDFYADWCGPCRMLSPVLNEINNEYGDQVTVAKVNVDENPKAAIQQQVMSIPTLKFVKNGKVLGTSVGFKSKEQLKNMLNSLLV
ncbi:thioredoxin [Marinicrinis lubricantis]